MSAAIGNRTGAALTRLPDPRFPDPRDAPVLRWGILAPGWIASMFARSLRAHTDQQIVAVGSRDAERARSFADTYAVPHVHGSYEDLVADPEVDVVYVASPHSRHRDQALLAIAAGKHVLVEKAFTRNAAEAQEVVDAARAAGVFVMEAMWTRYLPYSDVLRQLLEDGVLGEPRFVTADFAARSDPEPGHRLLDPALAGGVLLDLGIYPLSFATFALGLGAGVADARVQTAGLLAPTGVDAQVAATLTAGVAQAQIFSSMHVQATGRAVVAGTLGRAVTGPDFYAPTDLHVQVGDQHLAWSENRITGHDGLCFQAAALARYVDAGRTESPLLGLDETVGILRVADRMRADLGVVYPGEH